MKNLILLFLFLNTICFSQHLSIDKNIPLIILINPNAHQVFQSKIQKELFKFCNDTLINSDCYMSNYEKIEKQLGNKKLENSDFYGAFKMLEKYLKKYKKNIIFHSFNSKVWNQDLDSIKLLLSKYPKNSELVLFDHHSLDWMFGLTTDKNQENSFYSLIESFSGKNIFIGSCNSENLVEFLPANKNYLVIDKYTKYFIQNQNLGNSIEEILVNDNKSKWIQSSED